MNLTKRQALEMTRDLWRWLAEVGAREKGKWPGWKGIAPFVNDCPCCEFATQQTNGVWKFGVQKTCQFCPLLAFWPDGCETNRSHTAWDYWLEANPGDPDEECDPAAMKSAAAEIANAAQAELDKLTDN